MDVVQLGHRPGSPARRETGKVTGCLVGQPPNLMAANVVGMWVAAVLVVVVITRPKLRTTRTQRLRWDTECSREAVIRQRWR